MPRLIENLQCQSPEGGDWREWGRAAAGERQPIMYLYPQLTSAKKPCSMQSSEPRRQLYIAFFSFSYKSYFGMTPLASGWVFSLVIALALNARRKERL